MSTPARRRGEALAGFLDIMPLMLGAIPFALLLGALAVQKGLSPFEVFLMSASVYAGSAQFIAIDMWTSPAPVVAIVVATLLVNARHLLMGAALKPHLGPLAPWQRWTFVAMHTDESWAVALRRAAGPGLSPAYVFGMIVPFYLGWPFWTTIGALFGAAIDDPARYGIDFVFPAVFTVLIVGFWKGRTGAAVVAGSACAALAAHAWLPGVWYLFAGGLTGILLGALMWRPEPRQAAA